MKCPNCGKIINNKTKICPNCKVILVNESSNNLLSILHKHTKVTVNIIIPVMVTLITTFILFVCATIYNYFFNTVLNPIIIEEYTIDDAITYGNITDDVAETYYEYHEKADTYIGAFTINMYIKNIKDNPVIITNYKMNIDEIYPIEYENIKMFTIYNNNVLSVYVINNGNTIEQNIQCDMYCKDENGTDIIESDILESNQLYKTNSFCNRIKNLKPGDIKKIGEYTINYEAIKQYDLIVFFCNIKKEGYIISEDSCMATIQANSERIIYNDQFSYGVDVDVKPILINVDYDKGNIIELGRGDEIPGNGYRNAQFIINTTKSAELTIHIDIKSSGHSKISSKKINQKIYIPLYKYDHNDFRTVKKYMLMYGIDEYHYNENVEFQNNIDFLPQDLISKY